MKIFLAGATGIVGTRLIPLLLSAGHEVTGTARSPEKAASLRALGAGAVIVDALDGDGLNAAVHAARPEVVIHQLTSLPDRRDPERLAQDLERNAQLRREGTRHLVAAALRAGARRIVAQSVAWLYAAGPLPHGERDPLDLGAEGLRAVSVRGVSELERLVSSASPVAGIVLRFGYLYGPGTWYAEPTGEVSLHIDAAAQASALAVTQGAPGFYNVVDDAGSANNAKARLELGWEPSWRRPD
jgi:nucleoside-diphosphate-sugar epimerase